LKNLFVFLFLFPLFSFAQNIKGSIIDKISKLPIQDANVSIYQTNESTTTDDKGEFKLKTTRKLNENDSLYVTHIGYTPRKIGYLNFKKNNNLIFLEEQIEQLNGLTLSVSNKELKNKLAFTKLAPLKYRISSFGSVLNDSKIYVIGGESLFKADAWKKLQYEKPDFSLNDYITELQRQSSGQYYKGNLLIYDIKANQWETSNIKFRKRAYHNLNIYRDTIYVLGGKKISVNGKFEYLDDKIEVFDINKGTITIDNTNPHQAANAASFTYNKSIITIGGSIKMTEKGVKTYTDKVHKYDINTGYWYELKNMPTAKEASAVLIKDKIYLIGGNNGKSLSTIESFDLTTETWKNEGELLNGLDFPAVTNNDDTIYFFENEKIYTYEINTKTLKEYLISLPLKGSKLYFYGDKLYILGGYLENYYSQYSSSNFYSIDINEFKNTKPNRIKISSI